MATGGGAVKATTRLTQKLCCCPVAVSFRRLRFHLSLFRCVLFHCFVPVDVHRSVLWKLSRVFCLLDEKTRLREITSCPTQSIVSSLTEQHVPQRELCCDGKSAGHRWLQSWLFHRTDVTVTTDRRIRAMADGIVTEEAGAVTIVTVTTEAATEVEVALATGMGIAVAGATTGSAVTKWNEGTKSHEKGPGCSFSQDKSLWMTETRLLMAVLGWLHYFPVGFKSGCQPILTHGPPFSK